MNRIADFLSLIGAITRFELTATRGVFRSPMEFDHLMSQIREVGIDSLLLIFAAGLFLGVVITLHTRLSPVSSSRG
jgi:ABC-type transporter Mla maintaining outer membrane lipid asymmetry permease subunit MlaE